MQRNCLGERSNYALNGGYQFLSIIMVRAYNIYESFNGGNVGAYPIRVGLVDGIPMGELKFPFWPRGPVGYEVPPWSWGYRGQQERSPRLTIKRPDVCAWFGAGGEANLQALRVKKRRYVLLVRWGSTPWSTKGRGNATVEWSVSLATMCCSTTHIWRLSLPEEAMNQVRWRDELKRLSPEPLLT